MIRSAVYIRVSTEEQVLHGYSLEAQKEALTGYAKSHGFTIVDYYIDEGVSARKKMAKRKEFLRMIADVEANQIDLIIFTKLDRWFRNIADYYKIQEILEAHQVNWKTIYENYDTQTANGRLHINIMLSIAQDEADRTSERIKVVFQNKRNRGEVTNGSHPFGFKIKDKKLVPDGEILIIVRDIFDFYEESQSVYDTVRMLREKYQLNFCNATISRMLKNRIYIGEYQGIRNYTKPIIEPQHFNRIQAILPLPKKRSKTNRVYLFTGLLVCGECSNKLTANHSTVKYKETRREYNVYRCKRYTDQKLCTHKKVLNERILEQFLLKEAAQALSGYRIIPAINEPKDQTQSNKYKLLDKMEKLKELYLENLIDMDSYRKDYQMLNNRLETIYASAKNQIPEPLNCLLNADFNSIYYLLSTSEKRLMWRAVIDRIVVDGNNELEVFYK
jgi:DNA invertase Pin-like site-specific DNA recombinase